MKYAEIILGKTYNVLLSGKIRSVKLIGEHHAGGFFGVNLTTGREVRIPSAKMILKECPEPKTLPFGHTDTVEVTLVRGDDFTRILCRCPSDDSCPLEEFEKVGSTLTLGEWTRQEGWEILSYRPVEVIR